MKSLSLIYAIMIITLGLFRPVEIEKHIQLVAIKKSVRQYQKKKEKN